MTLCYSIDPKCPQNLVCRRLGSHLMVLYYEVVEPLGSRVYLEACFCRVYWDPARPRLILFYHVLPAIMFCLNTGPKATVN
jgi:hypothetical protein